MASVISPVINRIFILYICLLPIKAEAKYVLISPLICIFIFSIVLLRINN